MSRRSKPPTREPLQRSLAVRRPTARLQTAFSFDAPAPPRPRVRPPEVFVRRRPARPTEVYDTYWRFAAERQAVFMRRFQGEAAPWTADVVLRAFKFTNAYRAADRTSQYLLRRVIYRDDLPGTVEEVVFRVLLFKLFNKTETWEALERAFGAVTYETFATDQYDRVLTEASARGPIYNGAYIMPSCGQVFGHARKHRNHLDLLAAMMDDGLPRTLAGAPSMEAAFEAIRAYPSIGDFLAYQYVTDVNYSEVTDFSEMEFVVPGPGARSGLRKCFADGGDWDGADLIRAVAQRQREEFDRVGVTFDGLWGRPLQLIDCQNLFCEVDKYARVVHPSVEGMGGRTRIKQRFAETPRTIDYFFPPKWGINDRIETSAFHGPNGLPKAGG